MDNVDWWARVIGGAGVLFGGLSLFINWKNRKDNQTQVRLDMLKSATRQGEKLEIVVRNLSPHPVVIESMGAVKLSGELFHWIEEIDEGPRHLPWGTVDARSLLVFEQTLLCGILQQLNEEAGEWLIPGSCFVKDAAGKIHCTISRPRRMLYKATHLIKKKFSRRKKDS